MAEDVKASGTMSFFERGVEAMLLKLEHDRSDSAKELRRQAIDIRDKARAWTPETTVEVKKFATDELFALFRLVMNRK